ncbi:DUF2125 domain-containing protein [Halovulum dunhuangense]|uniref:DUF2125 domain-containing protein n=1 Tax=Halovulum dunhuangense TaxID=1505036 RepID=A0A849L036_9RHOB|nr:DUF2125 domain-containing protein [Halovulum dunhuangense]NNU79040.1 DUF2125 domain-containing protein [Halovulum dunhuangense]
MTKLLGTTALCLALPGLVLAQSAAEIQSAVEAGIERLNAEGANISVGGTTVEGEAVLLSDVVMSPDDGSLVLSADFLRFAPSSDQPGHVVVTVPPTVEITATPNDGTPPMDMTFASEGLALTTNTLLGPVEEASARLEADSITLTGGDPSHPVLKAMNFAPTGISGSLTFNETSRDATGALSIETMDLSYLIGNPEYGSTVETSVQSAAQSIAFAGTALPGSEADFQTFLQNGGAMSLIVEGGASTTRFASNDPEMPVTIEGSGDGGVLEMSLVDGAFSYLANFENVVYAVTPDPMMGLPPVDLSMAGGETSLSMPLAPSEEAQEAAIGLSLRELEIGESLWAMIDPGTTIPRDPATLELALSAAVRLTEPLSSAAEGGNPMELGEIVNASIDRLFLSLGGATLEAGGAVVMDNTGPAPVPNGSIDVAVSGAQGLAESLSALGLVDPMQVGMMMGMLMAMGQPGAEPDTYTSTIEFRDGGVFANGQPLQ